MLYDKSFYTNMISQITIFLSSENNYIHSIKCEDINYSSSFGFSFIIRFKTTSGYSIKIEIEQNIFGLYYENSCGSNGLGNIVSYNNNSSVYNIKKAIKLFKLLDYKKKLWIYKWTGQREITIVDSTNHITVIPANNFDKYKKKKKVSFFKKIILLCLAK